MIISFGVNRSGRRPMVPDRDKSIKIRISICEYEISIADRMMVGRMAFSWTCHPSMKYKKERHSPPRR